MLRAPALVLVLVAGCATGRIDLPDGTAISGTAFGQSKIEVCVASRILDVGPLPPLCATIEGGPVSGVVGGIAAGLISGAVAYFSMGTLGLP